MNSFDVFVNKGFTVFGGKVSWMVFGGKVSWIIFGGKVSWMVFGFYAQFKIITIHNSRLPLSTEIVLIVYCILLVDGGPTIVYNFIRYILPHPHPTPR